MKITDKKIIKVFKHKMTPEKIWSYFTTHEGLLKFFGADNKIELKPGGPYEIYFLMDNPYGLRGSETCKVLSFIPHKMFSFTWNIPPQFKALRESQYKSWVVLEFEDKKVTLTHLGWPAGDEWLEVVEYFERAWDVVFDNLKKAEAH